MPILPTPESTVKAHAERGNPKTTTPEAKAAAKAYKDIFETKGPEKVTEMAAFKKEKLDEKSARQTIKENIGKGEIDKATGDKIRDVDEEKRFQDATEAEDLVLKFLKEGKGLSGLADAGDQKKIIDQVKARMDEWDKIGNFFDGKSDAEKAELVRQWLEDPKFINKVKDLREARVVNPSEKIGVEGQENENQIKELEQQIEAKTKEVEANQEQQREQYGIIESFEDHSATGGKRGDNHKRLADIDVKLKSYTPTKLQTLRREKAQFESRVKQLTEKVKAETPTGRFAVKKTGPTQTEADLAQAQTDLEARIGSLEDYDGYVKEKNELLEKQKSASGSYKELTEEHIQKTDEINSAQKEIFVLKAEQGMVGRDRAEAEKAFVVSLQEIYGDALDELWAEQIKTLEDEVFKRYREEIDNPATNADRRALLSALEFRYQKRENEREHGRFHLKIGKGDVRTVADKDKIEKDLEILKKNSNPEENLVRKALAGAINPETKKPYKPDEINAIFAANPNFGKDNIHDVAAWLIAKGLQTKQVSAKDINTFVAKGFISEEKMKQTIAESQPVKNALKKAGISEKMIPDLVKNKKFAWWLALLFLFPLGGIAVGSFVAGKHVLAKDGGGQDGGHSAVPAHAPELPPAPAEEDHAGPEEVRHAA